MARMMFGHRIADNPPGTLLRDHPLWVRQFSAAATVEHWDVFDLGPHMRTSEMSIQRTDVDPGPWKHDAQAVTHVAVMAIFGLSELHMLALKLEYNTNREHYDKL